MLTKYTPDYECRVLNRLADMAYKHGGTAKVRETLDRAMVHIWEL